MPLKVTGKVAYRHWHREVRDSFFFQRVSQLLCLIRCNVSSTPVKEVMLDDKVTILLLSLESQWWHLGSMHVFYFISPQALCIASIFLKVNLNLMVLSKRLTSNVIFPISFLQIWTLWSHDPVEDISALAPGKTKYGKVIRFVKGHQQRSTPTVVIALFSLQIHLLFA